MSFKFSYQSLKSSDEKISSFALLPSLVFVKDYSVTPKSFSLIIICFGGGISMTYTKPRVMKNYVMCKEPISKLLTKGKYYELIKTVGKCYYIKRDDGTENVITKARFHPPIKKYESNII